MSDVDMDCGLTQTEKRRHEIDAMEAQLEQAKAEFTGPVTSERTPLHSVADMDCSLGDAENHDHTGWGPDRTFDCEGCEDEINERMASRLQRASENTLIAEWFRVNAPRFVEKFLSETLPSTTENVDSPKGWE